MLAEIARYTLETHHRVHGQLSCEHDWHGSLILSKMYQRVDNKQDPMNGKVHDYRIVYVGSKYFVAISVKQLVVCDFSTVKVITKYSAYW